MIPDARSSSDLLSDAGTVTDAVTGSVERGSRADAYAVMSRTISSSVGGTGRA
jgi:hypothetical protein